MGGGYKITAGPQLEQITNVDDDSVGRRINFNPFTAVPWSDKQSADGIRGQERQRICVLVRVDPQA